VKHSGDHIWQEDFFRIFSVKYHHSNWSNPEPILLDLNHYYLTPIIVGENGTGKTALFQILVQFSSEYKQLKGKKLEDFKNKLNEKGIDFLEIKYSARNISERMFQMEYSEYDNSDSIYRCQMKLDLNLTGISRFEIIDDESETRCSLTSELMCSYSPPRYVPLNGVVDASFDEVPPLKVQIVSNEKYETSIVFQEENQVTYSVNSMLKFLENTLSKAKAQMTQKYSDNERFISLLNEGKDDIFKLPDDATLVKCPKMQPIKLFESRKAFLPNDGDHSSLDPNNHHDYEKIIREINDEEFQEIFNIQKNTGQISGHWRVLEYMDCVLDEFDDTEMYDAGEVYYFDSHTIFRDLIDYKWHEKGEENPQDKDYRFGTTFLSYDYGNGPTFYCEKNLNRLIELLKEEFCRIPDMAKPYILSLIWGIPPSESLGLMFTNNMSEHYNPGGYMTDGQKRLFSIAKFCADIGLSRGKIIGLIDEPEASLHLDWQRKLITELLNITGRDNQIIIATHSPDIVINHIDRVIELNSNLKA